MLAHSRSRRYRSARTSQDHRAIPHEAQRALDVLMIQGIRANHNCHRMLALPCSRCLREIHSKSTPQQSA